MAQTFESALSLCLRSLSAEDKQWLEDRNCGVLATLRFAKLDRNFLNAALNFWDPNTHCFSFHGYEITPLPEELGAIINWPSAFDIPCLPDLTDRFHRSFEGLLDLSSHALGEMVHGREIDLVKFVNHFMNQDPLKKFSRRIFLVFCLFARFLFVHEDPFLGHASIISVVEQCEKGRNPMPLCTGELLVSLDRAKQDSSKALGGCPLLLQIWLMERLGFIEPPAVNAKYNPKGLLSRKRLHESSSEHGWSLILSKRNVNMRWTVPWWEVGTLVDTQSSPYIRVASLSILTFYFPVRVRRQYGERQTVPDSDNVRPLDKPMLHGTARTWEEYWRSRPRTLASHLARKDAHVSRHYLAWIATRTLVGTSEARAAERGIANPDLKDAPASKSRALTVKDRLGPRRLPVWGRLEKLPPLMANPKKAKEGKRERETGESSGSAKGKEKIE